MLEVLAIVNRIPQVLEECGIEEIISFEVDLTKETHPVSVHLNEVEDILKFPDVRAETEFLEYTSEWRIFYYAEYEGIAFTANAPA